MHAIPLFESLTAAYCLPCLGRREGRKQEAEKRGKKTRRTTQTTESGEAARGPGAQGPGTGTGWASSRWVRVSGYKHKLTERAARCGNGIPPKRAIGGHSKPNLMAAGERPADRVPLRRSPATHSSGPGHLAGPPSSGFPRRRLGGFSHLRHSRVIKRDPVSAWWSSQQIHPSSVVLVHLPTMLFTLLAGSFLQAATADASSCTCGYVTNTGEVWQSKISTTFNTSSNGSYDTSAFLADWAISSVQRGDLSTSVPYTINYTTANVYYPNASTDALVLVASAYTGDVGGAIKSAEIATVRGDILYGSFRSTYKVTGGAGAVSGFFSYADDENENDVEVLTSEDGREIHFTNQPSPGVGGTYAYNGTSTEVDREYRFDWTSAAVTYYVDNTYATEITDHPSTEASNIQMNMWSDGGPYSSGPPTSDVFMSITSITLYFNSSSVNNATFDATCASSGVAVCQADAGVSLSGVPTTTTAAASSSATSKASSSATSSTIKAKTTSKTTTTTTSSTVKKGHTTTTSTSTTSTELSAASVAAIAHAQISAGSFGSVSYGILSTLFLALATACIL